MPQYGLFWPIQITEINLHFVRRQTSTVENHSHFETGASAVNNLSYTATF